MQNKQVKITNTDELNSLNNNLSIKLPNQKVKITTYKTLHQDVLKAQATSLLSDFKFNTQTIFYNMHLSQFISKAYYGINKGIVKSIEERSEITKNQNFDNYGIDKWLVLTHYLNTLVPSNNSIKERLILNLNFLFLIKSYRGWRHTFSLPTRGQRTWSNGWSAFKSKNYLREYMFNCFKSGLANAHPEEIKNAFYLEQLNSLWKTQWEKDWLLAYKKRQAQLKKTKGLKKLELSSLANVNPNFTKAKKQVIIPVGFDNGFTKTYLKEIKQQFTKKKS